MVHCFLQFRDYCKSDFSRTHPPVLPLVAPFDFNSTSHICPDSEILLLLSRFLETRKITPALRSARHSQNLVLGSVRGVGMVGCLMDDSGSDLCVPGWFRAPYISSPIHTPLRSDIQYETHSTNKEAGTGSIFFGRCVLSPCSDLGYGLYCHTGSAGSEGWVFLLYSSGTVDPSVHDGRHATNGKPRANVAAVDWLGSRPSARFSQQDLS